MSVEATRGSDKAPSPLSQSGIGRAWWGPRSHPFSHKEQALSPGWNRGWGRSPDLPAIAWNETLNTFPQEIQGLLSANRITECPSESEVAQSCPTLCDPMDYSLPGSSVRGIFQARVLEWIAISFSRGSSQPRDWTQVSCIAGKCFTVWATTEAPSVIQNSLIGKFQLK